MIIIIIAIIIGDDVVGAAHNDGGGACGIIVNICCRWYDYENYHVWPYLLLCEPAIAVKLVN